MTMRTGQRKRVANDGEIMFRNRSGELENEDGMQQAVTEGGRTQKKRRLPSMMR